MSLWFIALRAGLLTTCSTGKVSTMNESVQCLRSIIHE